MECDGVHTPSIDFNTPFVAYRKWLFESGISDTTGWRWVKKGWLHPINIAGRLYLTKEDIAAFQARAERGEFAKRPTGAAGRVLRREQGGEVE